MTYLLTQLLTKAFERECGKWQSKHCQDPAEHEALEIDVALHVDHDKEEGYRNLKIVVYGPNNYVQVWVREDWDVIPSEGIGYNEEENDTYIKPGYDYAQGQSDWEKVADHDSCWRDGLRRVFQDNESRLSCFNMDVYRVVKMSQTGIPLRRNHG